MKVQIAAQMEGLNGAYDVNCRAKITSKKERVSRLDVAYIYLGRNRPLSCRTIEPGWGVISRRVRTSEQREDAYHVIDTITRFERFRASVTFQELRMFELHYATPPSQETPAEQ